MTRNRHGAMARIRRAVKRSMVSSPGRDKWQRPDAVIAALEIQPGERIADLGTGGGYFALRFARATGPTGIVYAIDTDEDMLDSVEEATTSAGLSNIRPIRVQPEALTLPERVDLVFLANAYHHLTDQGPYFERLATQLAPGARVAVLEALPGGVMARLFGHVTPPTQIREQLQTAGYRLQAAHDLVSNQSFQVFTRADGAD